MHRYQHQVPTSQTWSQRGISAVQLQYHRKLCPNHIQPDSKIQRAEFFETNDIDPSKVSGMWWIKPIGCRHACQTSAHLLLTLANANMANHLILHGTYFCNFCATIIKSKCDPLRCLKCQKYARHMAHDCLKPVDSCGTCGGAHHMTAYNNTDKKWCILCQSDTHSSWDRDCLTFNKKADEFDLCKMPSPTIPQMNYGHGWMLQSWKLTPHSYASPTPAQTPHQPPSRNPTRPGLAFLASPKLRWIAIPEFTQTKDETSLAPPF